MNAATLLICPAAGAASAAGASGAAGGEASPEEGFASALASSLAGTAKPGSASDAAVTESLQPSDTAEDPTLADVMQWLCLPGAAPAPTQSAPGETLDTTPDEMSSEPQQQALALTTRSAARNTPTSSSAATSEEVPEGEAAEALSGAPFPETGTSAKGSAGALTTGAPPTQGPQIQSLAALATALVRDGAATANASSGTAVHASLRERVGTARWAEELGTRMVLMSVRGQQEGSLTLMPEHLGPLEVQISVNKDTASVFFGAQHADTRAALTEALPRLRELFAASGLSLGQAGVSEQAPRREAPVSEGARGVGASDDGLSGSEATEPAWRPMRTSLIDTYA